MVMLMRPNSIFFAAAWLSLVVGLLVPVRAQQAAATAACRVLGKAVSGAIALPGVAVIARLNDSVAGATSTETDGSYALSLPPGSYRVTAELPGFAPVDQTVA